MSETTSLINPQMRLVRRPNGLPTSQDLVYEERPVSGPAPGEVLVRNRFLSLDPYMRGRMNDVKSYAPPVALGDVMEGQSVGQVVSGPGFQEGEWVLGGRGWQHYSSVPPHLLTRVDADHVPPSAYLGVLGMPGITAWVGCTEIAPVKPGETFVVAAASGAVGAIAGQIARQMGARVVGIAGGTEKCAYVKGDLHFDECLDHRADTFAKALADACPHGIDVYFENVGGAVQQAVWPLLNPFARIAMCGMVAEYNMPAPPPGPNLMSVVAKRLSIRGFIVGDHPRQFSVWRETGESWIREGRLRYRENVVKGLKNAPQAFVDLLSGKNFGKMVIALD